MRTNLRGILTGTYLAVKSVPRCGGGIGKVDICIVFSEARE